MYHWYQFENRKNISYSSFPIEYHYVSENHPRYVMPFHWHNECELIRVLEGKLTIITGEENFTIKENEILYIPENTVHGASAPKEENKCKYECIVFDFASILQTNIFINNYSDFLTHKKKIQNVFGKAENEIVVLMKKLFETAKTKNYGWQLTTIGCLFQFLGLVAEKKYFSESDASKNKHSTKDINSIYIEKFGKVFDLIRENYKTLITLDDMANATGMSPKYFCHMFKQLTHYTPIEYLLNYRIEFAKYLLSTKKMQVSDVSIQTGFNSTAYFIKIFKKFTGVTPKQYAKSLDTYTER